MERDKIIAIVLVVGLVFLFVALLSVIAVTGFVLLFVTSSQNGAVDNTPIIETNVVPEDNDTTTNDDPAPDPTPDPIPDPTPDPIPDPIPDPEPEPTAELLEGMEVDAIYFWCPANTPAFSDEIGLGLNRIVIKNDSGSDFSYDKVKVRVTLDDGTTTSANTKNIYDFSVDDDGTTDIYRSNFVDGSSTLLMGESSGTSGTITLEFRDEYYLEYDYTLTGQDFADAFCNN